MVPDCRQATGWAMKHSVERKAKDRLVQTGLLRRFRGDRKGAVAIEFIILAPLFFLMLFALLESCVAFAAQQVMTNAMDDVARQFRTGDSKVNPEEMNPEKLHDLICARMSVLFPSGCPGLSVDLRQFDTFGDAADALRNEIVPSTTVVDPGGALSKNVLRVSYRWPIFMSFLHDTLADRDDGTKLLFATTTWQNEPYN